MLEIHLANALELRGVPSTIERHPHGRTFETKEVICGIMDQQGLA
jgi:hypothetical protein